MRFLLGILLATVAVYAWGFVFWGLSPFKYTVWLETPDDARAQSALREHFPETGTYYVPSYQHEEQTLKELHAAGPVGFVHITAADGRPLDDMSCMLWGFVLYFVTAAVLAVLIRRVLPSDASYSKGVSLSLFVGILAALMIDVGGAVWWYLSPGWKLYEAFYHVTAFVVLGLVLSKMARPKPAAN